MPFIPGPSNIRGIQYWDIPPEQIESAVLIDQSQLNNSKLFSNRETYIKTLRNPQIRNSCKVGRWLSNKYNMGTENNVDNFCCNPVSGFINV